MIKLQKSLLTACMQNDEEQAHKILKGSVKKRVNPNCYDNNGSPLHYAVNNKNSKIIQWLIESNINVDVHNRKEETALHIACEHGIMNVVEYLVEQGADVDSESVYGTPLFYAIKGNHIDIVRYLVFGRADLDTSDVEGRGLIHEAVLYDRHEILGFLISLGININTRDNGGKTPLHMAVENDSKESLKMLLIYRGDLSIKDKNGKLPLDYSHTDSMKRFLELWQKERVFTPESTKPGTDRKTSQPTPKTPKNDPKTRTKTSPKRPLPKKKPVISVSPTKKLDTHIEKDSPKNNASFNKAVQKYKDRQHTKQAHRERIKQMRARKQKNEKLKVGAARRVMAKSMEFETEMLDSPNVKKSKSGEFVGVNLREIKNLKPHEQIEKFGKLKALPEKTTLARSVGVSNSDVVKLQTENKELRKFINDGISYIINTVNELRDSTLSAKSGGGDSGVKKSEKKKKVVDSVGQETLDMRKRNEELMQEVKMLKSKLKNERGSTERERKECQKVKKQNEKLRNHLSRLQKQLRNQFQAIVNTLSENVGL